MSSKRTVLLQELERVITPSSNLIFSEPPIAVRNGGFLMTYKAQHKEWGTVAYKKLKISFVRPKEGEKLKKEAAIQRQLHHPSIVTLVGMVFEDENYGLVLEYMRYHEVSRFLKDFTVDYGWKLQMIYDVTLGMNYLHTQPTPIIHGDLTAQNVLIGDGFKAKITDFGFSEWKDFSRSLSKDRVECGSVTHVPPENWSDPRQRKREKYDVYGFGIVVWEILAERPPYCDERGEALEAGTICKLVEQNKRPDLKYLSDQNIATDIKHLIVECWSQQAKQRPSFSSIKERIDAEWSVKQEMIVDAKKRLAAQEPGSMMVPHGSRPADYEPTRKMPKAHSRTDLSEMDLLNRFVDNYTKILRDVDPKGVMNYLDTEGSFDYSMIRDEVSNQSTKRKGCRMLLDRLFFYKPPFAFKNLLAGLQEEYPYLAEAIKSSYDEVDQPSLSSSEKQKNSEIKHKVVDIYLEFKNDIDPSDLLDHLFEKRIISLEEKKSILSGANTQKCCSVMLDFLFSSTNQRAFLVLRDSLSELYPTFHAQLA